MKELDGWIPVSDVERLPKKCQWVNLLQDFREDPFKRYCALTRKEPTIRIACGTLRSIDSEGFAEWQCGALASGHPLRILECVTYWRPLPEVPKELL
jgi:hypothetical protein